MRIGLIGLGRVGAFHAGILTTIPAIDSLVVTDLLPERTKSVADRYGAQGVDSLEALLDAGVDGVVIAASTHAHTSLVLSCVDAGLPTLCETPLAPDGAEGADLLYCLAGSTVPVQIGFQRRYDPAMAAAKAAVDNGDLGMITTVRSTTLDPEPPVPAYVAVSGGMFRDCGVHDFDCVRWVTGQEAIEVYAVDGSLRAAVVPEHGDVNTSAVIVTFAGGARGVVSNTHFNGRGHDVRLEVHGSKDSVAAGIEPERPMRPAGPGARYAGADPYRCFMDDFRHGVRSQLETFLDVVAGRRPSPCTVADALEAGWIAEACARSIEQHRSVRIEEVRIS